MCCCPACCCLALPPESNAGLLSVSCIFCVCCRYIQADENCDGVLSFDEFKELIQNVEASTAGDSSVSVATVVSRKHSSDAQYTNRRIVRMYREAQESGGSSGSITRDGFIRICGKYGFIPFIDLDDEPIDERDQGSEASPE